MSAPTARPAHLTKPALVVPLILTALGLFLAVGTATMPVVGDGGLFGPTLMPWVVAALCFVVAILLAVDILRPRPDYDIPAAQSDVSADAASATSVARPTASDGTTTGAGAPTGTADPTSDAGETATTADRVNAPAVLTAVGGVVGFIVALPWLGWILAATGLFVAVAAALGNRNWTTVLLAGLALASTVQIAFSMLLGISLPSGLVGGF